MSDEGGLPKRFAECESTNHGRCYGDLWQCIQCGKTVCSAEGSDNDPDLCDDCRVTIHHSEQAVPEADDDPDRSVIEPASDVPDMDTLAFWMWDGVAEATDGCPTEPDVAPWYGVVN